MDGLFEHPLKRFSINLGRVQPNPAPSSPVLWHQLKDLHVVPIYRLRLLSHRWMFTFLGLFSLHRLRIVILNRCSLSCRSDVMLLRCARNITSVGTRILAVKDERLDARDPVKVCVTAFHTRSSSCTGVGIVGLGARLEERFIEQWSESFL